MNKMPDTGLGPLAEGGLVAVIGGGPGGTAAAIALQAEARQLGRQITVTLVEGKQFEEGKHHNQCAGVVSPPITTTLESEIGVPFPTHLGRCSVTGYVLHANQQAIILDGESEPSISLRRVQFDAYMLEAARQRGVEVHTARATGLEFHDDRVVIYTESTPLAAQVVIGAFGLDEGTGAMFQETVGYRPPPALRAIVTKYHPGEEGVHRFGSRIHAFLPSAARIEFGGVTPKGNHLTINIAGKTVDANLMDSFLADPAVRQVLPEFENARRFDPYDLHYFQGRFPCGLARCYTGDRFVMVGDAAGLVRAFKGKGVTSAIQTGKRAAHAILTAGISGAAFRTYHAANRDITGDMPFGQVMRHLTILAARLGLMGVVIRAAKHEPGLQRALFDAVSAHHPYIQVVRDTVTLKATQAILGALLRR
jgi:flavin-dependent dehydrogenase